MDTTEVARVPIGTRRRAGTDWPVYDVLYRDCNGAKPRWRIARGLCNGVSSSVETYRTLGEAELALDDALESVMP